MRKADFQVRVRKIEIVNTVVKNRFAQTLRVVLDEGNLTGENPAELRQFRPNERVLVQITPLQLEFRGPAADTLGAAAFGAGAGEDRTKTSWANSPAARRWWSGGLGLNAKGAVRLFYEKGPGNPGRQPEIGS